MIHTLPALLSAASLAVPLFAVFANAAALAPTTPLTPMPDAPIPLWPHGAPGALGAAPKDIPTLTPYLADPANATGAAVVICPGGGYEMLAPYEGADYAQWFALHGIHAFVLQYRLASDAYRHPAQFDDVTRALRHVRANAARYHINPEKIGVVGSSAGGHLASLALTHFDSGNPAASDPIDRASSRPNFGILCYPVITMGPPGHTGSRVNILGPNADPALIEKLSSERQIKPTTPPCFIWSTGADKTVAASNSLMFAAALEAAHIPYDLHIYEKGGHGQGLGAKFPFANPLPWVHDLAYWLRSNGWLNA